MSIEANLIITLTFEDITTRFSLKNQIAALLQTIPKDEGQDTLRAFLENVRLRL